MRLLPAATFAAALAFAAMLPGALFASPWMTADGAQGKFFTDAKGMTLYTFDNDTKDTSACAGPCAAIWPPFAATAADKAEGDWGIITRADGAKQWTYEGHPLYTFAKDAKAGDMTGDGFKGIWHVAKP